MVVPILALLIFGFFDVARLYQSWITVQSAAREGARYGVTGRADCSIATNDRAACIAYAAHQRAAGLADSENDLTVVTTSWDFPNYTAESADGEPGVQCDLLEVTVSYEHTPSTPIISQIFGGIELTASEQMVNEPFGPCT